MDDGVVVRPATSQDVDAIRRVGIEAWPETYAFAGEDFVRSGLEQWWSQEAVHRGLTTTTTLVAKVRGVVVGMGNLDVRGEVPVIWKLYVVPGRQGAGIGGALLAALVDLIPGRPVELEYVTGNKCAAGFYARHGFREVRQEQAEKGPASIWLRREP